MKMSSQRKQKCMKYSTVIGSMLLLMPNGLFWYWGNLSVYTLSYFVFVCDSTSGIDTPWVISIFLIFWTTSITSSALLAKCVGRRYTVLTGALISDVAVFMSFFAVQDSLLALTSTMGGFLGLGTGLMDSSSLQLVIEWAEEDTGRLTSVVQGAFAFGGFIINQIITLYINPLNLSPDIELGRNAYFSQAEILNKVPYIYLLLGGFSFILHVTGFALLRPKQKKEKSPLVNTSSNSFNPGKEQGDRSSKLEVKDGASTNKMNSPILQGNAHILRDYTPKEMIQTASFWAIWITVFLGSISVLILTNYYKAFGQIWIHDDHFLTDIGTFVILINALVSFFWGMAMDKIGVKNCLIFNIAVLIIVMVWYYFCPMYNRWLYFFVTFLMGNFSGALLSCYTAATALLFGKKHFTSNFGIVTTAVLALNLIAPSILQGILSNLGWFSVFAFAGGLNFIRLLWIMILIPKM